MEEEDTDHIYWESRDKSVVSALGLPESLTGREGFIPVGVRVFSAKSVEFTAGHFPPLVCTRQERK